MPKNKYILLAAIFALTVGADQASKYLAVAHLTRAFEVDRAETTGARLSHFFSDRNLDGDPPTDPDLREGPVTVLTNFWHFKYVENPGAAWGLLGNFPVGLRLPFFHVVSITAVCFIFYFFRKVRSDQRYLQVALSLVLGGAVGNYLDRVIRNYVIDFIDWHWYSAPDMHWPTFNVADAAICVGVAMLLLEGVFTKKARPATESPALDALGPIKIKQEP